MTAALFIKLKAFFQRYSALPLWFILVLITRPYYYADSYEYAHTILRHLNGKSAPLFWESGHYLWRPMGEILFRVFQAFVHSPYGSSSFDIVSIILIFMVVALTLIGIFFFYRLLRLFPISELSVQIGVLFYVVSGCILNYCQTGTSYQPALSILVVSLYYNTVGPDSLTLFQKLRNSLLLAIPPLLWLPYVIVLPAMAFAHPMVCGWNRVRLKNSLIVGFTCIPIAIVLLSPAIILFHLYSIPAFMHWAIYQWGTASNTGPIRTIFGLPKALFYLGNDAVYVKRFLYHDPINPVSLPQLLSLGLWKLAVFYVLLGVSTLMVLRNRSLRPYLLFIAVGFIPVLILSVRWDGASLERHMPLFPFLFLLLALGFEASGKKIKTIFPAILLIVLAVNVSSMWFATNEHREEAIDARLHEIWPRLTNKCSVALLSSKDDYADFQSVHPFDTFNQSDRLQFFSTVSIGEDSAIAWKKRFETNAQETWNRGGDVWVTRVLVTEKPGDTIYWIENYQPEVKWSYIHSYFRSLDYSDSTPDFLLLARNSLPSK